MITRQISQNRTRHDLTLNQSIAFWFRASPRCANRQRNKYNNTIILCGQFNATCRRTQPLGIGFNQSIKQRFAGGFLWGYLQARAPMEPFAGTTRVATIHTLASGKCQERLVVVVEAAEYGKEASRVTIPITTESILAAGPFVRRTRYRNQRTKGGWRERWDVRRNGGHPQ